MRLALLIIALVSVVIARSSNDLNNKGIDPRIHAIDSQVVDVFWCETKGPNEGNVLIQTLEGSIYRSTDKMGHFENIIEHLINIATTHLNDSNAIIGEITSIQRIPNNPDMLILMSTGQANWISKDCGSTFRAFSRNTEKLKQVKVHPVHENWMLGLTDNVCSRRSKSSGGKNGSASGIPCFAFKLLWISEDSGISWTNLANYVEKFQWGYFNSTETKEAIPLKRIYWIEEIGNNQNQNRNGLVGSRHLFYSDDLMVTRKRLLEKGNVFHLDANYLYVLQVVSIEEQHVILKVGDPKQVDVKLHDISLGENLKNHKFSIADTSEGQVFINVNHLGQTSPMGTLYISDSTGRRFAPSLQGHLRSQDEGTTDFERLQGIYGVFIANIYDENLRNKFESMYSIANTSDDEEEDDIDSTRKQAQKDRAKAVSASSASLKGLITQSIQTMITFDKGGVWQRVSAPVEDHLGRPIKCGNACFLNIHSASNEKFNSFYSSSNAIGLVLANGNVGNYLVHDKAAVNTFMSRDAGLTWKMIKKGAYIFEIGDHGSLIVIGKDKDYDSTKEIEFSVDEGKTWQTIVISEEQLEIENIITEPTNVSTKFMILAQTVPDAQNNQNGMVITIDFASAFTRNCSGASSPDNEDSDYEKWVPHGYKDSKCLLGRTITFSRKKKDSVCLNGEEFERIISSEICVCTEEDWECDFGYAREGDSPCRIDSNQTTVDGNSPIGMIPEVCEDTYLESKGYRKVSGNSCVDGIDRSPERKPCPGKEFFTIKRIIVLVAIIGIIYYANSHRETLLTIYLNILHLLSDLKEYVIKQLKDSNRHDYIDFSSTSKHDDDDSHLAFKDTHSTGSMILDYLRKEKKADAAAQLQLDSNNDSEDHESHGLSHHRKYDFDSSNKQVKSYFDDEDDDDDNDDHSHRNHSKKQKSNNKNHFDHL